MIAKIIAHGATRGGGDRALAPGDRRHDGDDRGGHDQPGLPARAAEPPRGARRRRRHRLAGPPAGRGRRRVRAPRRRRAAARRDRAARRRDRDRPVAVLRLRAPRPPARRGEGARDDRPAPQRRELLVRRLPARARLLPGRRRRHAHRGPGSSAISEHESRLSYGGRSYRTVTALQDADLLVEVNGVPHRVSRDEGGLVRAHAPAVVVAIPVVRGRRGAGRRRRRGDRGDEDGGVADGAGPRPRAPGARGSQRPRPGGPAAGPDRAARERAAARPTTARRVAFDVRRRGRAVRPAAPASGSCSATTSTRPTSAAILRRLADAPVDAEGERALLEAYADVRALDRPQRRRGRARQPAGAAARVPALARPGRRGPARPLRRQRSSGRSRTTGSRGWSARPRSRPRATGCSSASCAPRPRGGAVQSVLTRHLERADDPAGWADERYRAVLDRLEDALAAREPALAELARELRWIAVRPPARRRDARGDLRGAWTSTCARWPASPAARSASGGVDALVACQLPLAPLLARRRRRPGAGRAPGAGRGDDAPLLPHPPARGVLRGTRARRAAVRDRVLRARGHAPPRRGRVGGAATTCRARSPRSPSTPARSPRASACSPTSTPGARTSPPTLAALLADADLPDAVARVVFVLVDSDARPGRGRADELHAPAGRRRRSPRTSTTAGCIR